MTRKKENETHAPDVAARANVEGDAAVVRFDRARDRLEVKRQDVQADALAGRFHTAMGWKKKPEKAARGKGKRKK